MEGASVEHQKHKPWSQRWGSNPRPAVYETAALPLSYVGDDTGQAWNIGAHRFNVNSGASLNSDPFVVRNRPSFPLNLVEPVL